MCYFTPCGLDVVPPNFSVPREVVMAQTIGFIGLGIMGRPMAKNLLKAGHPLVVHSRSQGPVDELVGAGAKRASSAKEVAGQVDVLITMLPNSPEVELVALGSDGIIEGAKKGLLFLDMSTISPLVSQKVGKALAAKGVRMLDAPVSGGEKGAIDAALTLKALGGGLAASKCLEQKTPNCVAGTYDPGFKIDLHFKDLGLIMESSRALGVPLPCTAVVQELFNALRVKGKGGLDHSGVITLLEELAGVPEKSCEPPWIGRDWTIRGARP